MPGRAATMVSSPSCRPAVLASRRSKPVGTPVMRSPRRASSVICSNAARMMGSMRWTLLASGVRAIS